jgi:hypothetical protein
MRTAIRKAARLAGLAALTACAHMQTQASSGRDFALPVFATFVLNRTSEAEAQASLGVPLKRSSMRGIVPSIAQALPPGTPYSITTLNYLFAPNGLGKPPAAHPVKLAFLWFFNDRLVAYVETSVLPGEATPPVDETRLTELHQGRTTRTQAIALLGTPNAQLLHILDAQHGTSQINYFWGHLEGDTVQSRALQINFDRQGKLSTYTLLDQSNPVGSLPIPMPTPQAPAAPGGLHLVSPGDLNHT